MFWHSSLRIQQACISRLGQHDKGLAEFSEAHRLWPESGLIYANLIVVYVALNHLEEARGVANGASAKNLVSPLFREALYLLAFLENDAAGKEQQVEIAKYVQATGAVFERKATRAIAITQIKELKSVHLDTDAE